MRALIWDVDGTIAETERDGHRVAFNQAFVASGVSWQWGVAEYGALLQVAGGRERLLHDMQTRAGAPVGAEDRQALAQRIHRCKNERYAALVDEGGITARPGVLRLMRECRQAGWQMAVATTTSRSNVDALFMRLLGPDWAALFAAVVCAEDAPFKKPHPQAYSIALQRLGLRAAEAFALEDSPNGLQAALAAGLRCGVTPSTYFSQADFAGAAWVQPDLDTPQAMTPARLQGTPSATIRPS